MSRTIDFDNCGNRTHETISSLEECQHLINDVCTNPDSEQCCDFPHPEYCIYRCPHYVREDGIITPNPKIL